MAQRYGGRYSPGASGGGAPASGPAAAPRRSRAGLRANLMFLPPAILTAVAALPGLGGNVVAEVAGAAALFLAAWLNREGLVAEDAFEAATAARRPAIPRKLMAAALTGAVAMGLRWVGADPVSAAGAGIAAAGLHLVAFGLDPMKDKRPAGVDAYQSERAQRVIDEAEGTLAEMRAQIEPLRTRALTERVDAFAAAVRGLAEQVAADPRDLPGARRYLGVYLRGARDATARFAALQARGPDEEARARWEALVDEMRAGVAQRAEKLRLDDRSGLDIEIDVLRDRLRREGVAITRDVPEEGTS